jgi:hypothetical protein
MTSMTLSRLSARVAILAAAAAMSALALAGCSSPTGGVGLPNPVSGATCPTLSVPSAADKTKVVKWPSTTKSKIVSDLAIGDLLKDSCYYDLADAPAEAEVGDSEGGLFVRVNPSVGDVKKFVGAMDPYLTGKGFVVTAKDTGFAASADTDKDGTDDVQVSASYIDKITQDMIDGDGGTIYKIFAIKAGGSLLLGSIGRG